MDKTSKLLRLLLFFGIAIILLNEVEKVRELVLRCRLVRREDKARNLMLFWGVFGVYFGIFGKTALKIQVFIEQKLIC